MKFKINGRTWEIKEVEQIDFYKNDEENEVDESHFYFGRTLLNKQEIWLYKKLVAEQKRQTLYHELMHCYICSYLTTAPANGLSEEFWCDISANSHDIIHNIVEKYFKGSFKE